MPVPKLSNILYRSILPSNKVWANTPTVSLSNIRVQNGCKNFNTVVRQIKGQYPSKCISHWPPNRSKCWQALSFWAITELQSGLFNFSRTDQSAVPTHLTIYPDHLKIELFLSRIFWFFLSESCRRHLTGNTNTTNVECFDPTVYFYVFSPNKEEQEPDCSRVLFKTWTSSSSGNYKR